RVPLDTDEAGRDDRLDAFHDAIVGPRDGLETNADAVRRLVVQGVDLDAGRSEHAGQQASRREVDLVDGLGISLLLTVVPARQCGNVLDERSAHGTVEDLASTAEPQGGKGDPGRGEYQPP